MMMTALPARPPVPVRGVTPDQARRQEDAAPGAATWALLLLLALGAAVARWVTRSRLIYGWDTVHYLLAQERYDILAHQPHPPGSFYYVLLARAVRLGAGDGHTALLLLSAASGAALVGALFLLGCELGGRRAGWLAAVTGATAPLFWFYGSLGLNYAPAGALAALFALGGVRAGRGDGPSLLLAGASLGLLGGFRPTDAVFLAPAFVLVLTAHLRSGVPLGPGTKCRARPYPCAVGSLALAAALTLGWLVPTLMSTGGPGPYAEALRALDHVFARSSVFRSGWPALNSALGTHWRTVEGSVGVTVLVGLAAWVIGAARRLQGANGTTDDACPGFSRGVCVLAAVLVGPAALFYLLGHFNAPGYALTYAGVLVACASAVAARGSAAGFGAMLAGIVLLNGALFLAGPAGIGQRALSAHEIADHDRYYREVRAFCSRSGERPLLLASANFTDGLRVVQALVPGEDAVICQASGHQGPLPEALRRLPWLDLRAPEEVRRAGRDVYAIRRTREDLLYHRAMFPEGFAEVPIGPGHVLLRLRKRLTPE